ncbi:aldo-keto reductase IolS [Abditibacteriota bacterium]|nr:aldo-keto reductase IolS [Abditibacteriota bacterium]
MNTTNNTTLPLRELGKTGAQVSEIGFGAWAIGGSWGETVEEKTALDALRAAADAGTTFFDTADVYGGGRSESLIGEFLRERRGETFFIATKMGRAGNFAPTYEVMERTARDSAKRLGVEALDLVQLHCLPLDIMRGEVWGNFERLKSAGLIKNYGASVESVEEALFCIENTACTTLQVIFNIFRQKLVDELFPVAQQNNIGIIARVPLASGLLTGKFGHNHQFSPDDHRNFNANGESFNAGETFAGVPFERGVELAQKVHAIVGNTAPLATLALRWILDFPAVSTVIPGAKNPRQAHQNVQASGLAPLSSEVHAKLRELYQTEIAPIIRGVY